nr:vegetative cell wall protein gp1-like [Aegilops tauschii subsp. strangulata]
MCIAAPPSPAPASSTLLLDRPPGASASSRHKPLPWLPRLPDLDLFSNHAQTPTRFAVATTSPRRRSASPDLIEPTVFALRPRGEAPGLSLSPRPRRRGRRSPHTHALPLTYRVGRLRPAPLPGARPCSTLALPDLSPPLPATPSASPVAANLRCQSPRPGYARPPLPASAAAALSWSRLRPQPPPPSPHATPPGRPLLQAAARPASLVSFPAGLVAAPVVARRRCPSAPLGPRLVGRR